MLQLAVDINGRNTGKIGEFLNQGGTLLSRRQELGELGLRVPEPSTNGADAPISLSSLKGVAWQLDTATQTLHLTAGNNALLPVSIRPDAGSPPLVAVRSGIGGVADYDVVATQASGHAVATGAFDLRAFSPWGTLGSGVLAYAGGATQSTLIRLDTAYTYADPASMRQYVLGDFITGGLNANRPIRLAGLQVSSNFATRPDLVTLPLPSVSGSVAVPSTLDVLLNGSRYVSRSLDAGPFEIPQLPVVTGAGTVAMTLTNAVGQQVRVELPVYSSAALLAPGLSSYSAQIGSIRHNYGLLSNSYGTLAGIASYRYGLTPKLTAEATMEAGPGLVMAGGGVALNVAGYAVLQASALGSVGAGSGQANAPSGRSGTQFAIGLQRIGRKVSLSASAAMASAGFRDLASASGDPVPHLRANASVGLSLGRFGSLAATYTGLDRGTLRPVKIDVPPGLGGYSTAGLLGGIVQYQPARRTHVVSASYSVQLGRPSLYLTGYKDLVRAGSAGVLLGLSIPLGGRSSGGVTSAFGSGTPSGQAQFQQSPMLPGDWGYRASAAADTAAHTFGELSYKSPWGLVSAGADRTGHTTSTRVAASGAASVLAGSLFLSNTIPDSFAVIDTDGVPNVGVLQENRPAGRTDKAGQLLVTNLRSFDTNRLAIEPNDVAPDIDLDTANLDVRPQYRSGVVVHFPMRRSQSALVRLIDETGSPIPLGSVARLRPHAARLPVGFDGETYVEHLEPKAELEVERPDGSRCLARFAFVPSPGDIPKIGPVRCQGPIP